MASSKWRSTKQTDRKCKKFATTLSAKALVRLEELARKGLKTKSEVLEDLLLRFSAREEVVADTDATATINDLEETLATANARIDKLAEEDE